MKAILVIEIDDELGKEMHGCDFIVTDRYGSKTIYPTISFKPMPQERTLPAWQVDYTNYGEEPWFSDGWNACVNEILGETE